MNFDPTTFLDATTSEATDTRALQIPEATYQAIIDKISCRAVDIKNGDRAGEVAVFLDVTWSLDDQELLAKFDRPKITVRQGIGLDYKSLEPFTLDMSPFKNRPLGLLREAVDLNASGQPFSFNMLVGRAAKVSVKSRIDGTEIYNDVKGVTKL